MIEGKYSNYFMCRRGTAQMITDCASSNVSIDFVVVSVRYLIDSLYRVNIKELSLSRISGSEL